MARVVRHKVEYSQANTSFTPVLPPHENGDLILCFMGNDINNSFSTVTPGWVKEEESVGVVTGACFSFYATSSSSTNPTFTTASTRDWGVVTVVIKDAPTSAAIDISSSSIANEFRTTTETVTTTVNNALIIEYVAIEENSRQMFFEPEINQIAQLNGTPVAFEHSAILGWHVQQLSGLSTGHTFANGNSNDSLVKLTIAIKDDGNANYPGYVDPTIPPAELLTPWSGKRVLAYYDDGTKDVDPTSLITTINGNATTYKAETSFSTIYPNISGCGFNITSSGDWNKPLVFQRGFGNTWDFSGDALLSFTGVSDVVSVDFNTGARYIGLGSGDLVNVATAAKLFQFESSDSKVTSDNGTAQFVIQPSVTADDTYGSIDLTNINKIFQSTYVTSSAQDNGVGFLYKLGVMVLIGGSTVNPCSFSVAANHARTGELNTVKDQKGSSASQFFCTQNIQAGNGSSTTVWNSSFQSIEYPSAYNAEDVNIAVNVSSALFLFNVKAASGDVITMQSCTFNMGDFHKWEMDATTSNTDIYDFTGLNILNSTVTLRDLSLVNYSGMALSGCKELVHNGADLSKGSGITIANCVDANAVTVDSEASFENLHNCTFNNNDRAIQITGNQTGSWSDPNITVNGNTYDIEYTGATNFSIQSANALTVNNTSSGVLTVVTPTFDLTVDSSETGSQIHVYTTGTQTILDSEASASQLVYTHSSETVDITVLKDGFIPYRQTGLALSGNVGIDVQLVASREYTSAHGLTYTTDTSWSRSLNQLTVPTWGVTGQEVFSLMLESFRTETSLYNTDFNIQMDGAGSLYLVDGAEGATDASIENLTECGCAYLNSSGVTTASWVGVKSVGDATGFTGEYQQVDGSGTTDARATGVFNELIKVFGDATHGNFDFTGHLVLKYQPNTYRESRSDVLADFDIGSLSPTLYIVALEPVSINITTGDPAISITIVDHTGAPLVVGGKSFDFEIQDNDANDGEAMLREVNYNLSQDAVYQGRDPFNWPEMLLQSGSTYETIYGIVEGLSGLHGIYVSRSAADHPDFTRHQSNDGTYYVKPITANASISNIVAGSRLRIYNETTATETYNDIPGISFSDSYTEGTIYTAGDVITIYLTQTSGVTAKLPFTAVAVASSSGWAILAGQVDDEVYNQYGLNGSTITEFTADYVNDEVDLAVASNFSGEELYAWWSYNLTTSQGVSDFFGGITAQDAANILINNSIVSIFLDNTTSTNVYQTDNIRVYRADGAYPVKNPTSGGGGIDVVWRDRVFIAETGVSGLTPTESSQLAEISSVNTKVDVIDTNVDSVLADTSDMQPKQDQIISDIAGIPTSDATLAKQDEIISDIAALNNISPAEVTSSVPTVEQIADKTLGRNLAGGVDGGRTVKDALRANRNRVTIDPDANTITVYEEDDITPAWTGAITTGDRDPINDVDPA